jgi:demethoxyubiquinone hydroxylase (CLK1/Coq7/Cat5 family)
MINNPSNYLARLVYDIGVKKQIEERVEAKYSKRIEYLVNANDELMYELEQCELECYGRGFDTNE